MLSPETGDLPAFPSRQSGLRAVALGTARSDRYDDLGFMSELDVFGIVGSTQAGAFRVEEAVAEGGFAVVYRAYHNAFRAPVALKCLKVPTTLSKDHQTEFLEQFRAEAELLFRLSARIPAVVRPLHADTIEGANTAFVPFLALEWLEGCSLEELLEGRLAGGLGPLPLPEVTRLLAPVAEGLHRAHNFPSEEGTICVLHRDLKPANIFVANVAGKRSAKILDFGIAKVKSAATAVVGKASMVSGTLTGFTPGYAAPEQWAPKRFGQTGPWTDVWGLALTIVEAVIGRAPIDGDQAAMLGAALDPSFRPTPANLGVSVGDRAEAVFTKALAVDPKNRFLEVESFYRALEAAIAGKPETVVVAVSSPSGIPNAMAGTQAALRPSPALAAAPAPAPVPEIPDIAPVAAPPAASRGNVPFVAGPAVSQHPPVPDLTPGPSRGAPKPRVGAAPKPRPSRRVAPSGDDSLFDDFAALVDPDPLAGRGADPGPTAAEKHGGKRPKAKRITLARDDPAGGLQSGPSLQQLRQQRFQATMGDLAHQTRSRRERVRAHQEAVSSVRERLRLPSRLVIVGIVIAAVALAYESASGTHIPGPIRPLWISGPLVLFGFLIGAYRLLLHDDE